MNAERFMFSGSEGTPLCARLYLPNDAPKYILQVTHGMTEHIARYERLAQLLTAQGVVVAGFDMRGHGANTGDSSIASFGEDGWEKTLEDMHLFYEYLQERFEALPHFMLGFSLGSFLLREYLSLHPEQTAGAIIVGTGQQAIPILSTVGAVVKTQLSKCGTDGTTPLVRKMSFETYNRKFAPNRTDFDWLCADEAQLDEYIQDKLCRDDISAGLFYQLLNSMKRTGRSEAYAAWRKDMPVLLLSGQDDPVGDFGKGVRCVEAALRSAGMTNVRLRLFPNARHDLLHEEQSGNAEAARTLISEWLTESAYHYESIRRTMSAKID